MGGFFSFVLRIIAVKNRVRIVYDKIHKIKKMQGLVYLLSLEESYSNSESRLLHLLLDKLNEQCTFDIYIKNVPYYSIYSLCRTFYS